MKTIRKIEKGSPHCFARLRVAAYCRVSTDQYEQLESLETQRSHYDEYIRAHKDWELVNVYYDEGISGTRADTRPGLQRLMADCRLRRIDMVLTKSISRFARNTADCLALVRELISLNIPIHFEKENLYTAGMPINRVLRHFRKAFGVWLVFKYCTISLHTVLYNFYRRTHIVI
ncbi:MAG: recombinase family protein [Ruminobacter sp.]|uniref:recombinase family protein n=1 Tax=Ruminobacter sp. TaxID=2774296 RepID=UPI001B5FB05F|nr:recombinase family protein [Ruminobacter sp.]MBP3749027.1 recombinase family protein [Ruminobacter sp.]